MYLNTNIIVIGDREEKFTILNISVLMISVPF